MFAQSRFCLHAFHVWHKPLRTFHSAILPTPVEQLKHFGTYIGCPHLYIKRDDLTGTKMGKGFRLYGGNKPRKLEFLLADARAKGAQTVITYGCVGSNHALATAVYAHELGLKSILLLKDQPNSYIVRHNLLLDHAHGAQLQFFANNHLRAAATEKLLAEDAHAYFIPTGGSNALGTVGFVNAAFELADQVKKGDLQEPDLIYIAAGSSSSASVAGLLVGILAAGLHSDVVAVCVEPEEKDGDYLRRIRTLFLETNELLHAADASFPFFAFPTEKISLNKKFCGTQYGLLMPETKVTMEIGKNLENITLEGTYSAKVVAAIIDDAQAHAIDANSTILFWNTYCGIDFSHLCNWYDYKKLPPEFHIYFTAPVQ